MPLQSPTNTWVMNRIKPRFIFFNVDAVRAVLMIVTFVALYLSPQATFPALATMMALLSVAYVLNFVATDALLPRHISPDALPKTHTMLQGVDQITMVLGPAVASCLCKLSP
ncbi:hypothetical protein [Pectobacterium parmentieri]|uniref:hypothetical protein n=1 Tax=Pectobacterium parmentieri TaxID=1905730 RepID=UPI0018E1A5A1|nr:hypothetical protein [Pectobacterium parmentieri]QQA76360.1 hypothetical protein JBL47_01640 [Pectobacterium parmentieri]